MLSLKLYCGSICHPICRFDDLVTARKGSCKRLPMRYLLSGVVHVVIKLLAASAFVTDDHALILSLDVRRRHEDYTSSVNPQQTGTLQLDAAHDEARPPTCGTACIILRRTRNFSDPSLRG